MISRECIGHYTLLITVGVITGVSVALFEIAFETLIRIFRENILYNKLIVFLLVPVGLITAYAIVLSFAKIKETGSGTHQILDAFFTHNGYIHPKDTVVKTIASIITLGFGGSAGPEGPSMLLGSGITSWLARKLKLSQEKLRKLSLAGASAGISAIFRAPLTGMLFALEIPFRKDIESEAFLEAIIASVASYLTFVSIVGPEKLFKTEYINIETNPIYLFYSFVIGIISSFVALAFIISYKDIKKISRKLRVIRSPYNYLEPLVGGLIIAFFIYLAPDVAGPGYKIIRDVIRGPQTYTIEFLLLLTALKIVNTDITLTFGGSGGVFIPSLVVGALTGYMVSLIFNSPNSYIFVTMGMAALLAATNKCPLTSIALVAETVGPGTIIPTIIASITSFTLTGYYSFFEIQPPYRISEEELALNELYYKVQKEKPHILNKIKATEMMTTKPIYLSSNEVIHNALRKIEHFNFRVYPVVDSGKLIGYITIEDLLGVPDEERQKKIEEVLRPAPKAKGNTTLRELVEKMLQYETDHIFIVDDKDRLVGVIADIDIIKILLRYLAHRFRIHEIVHAHRIIEESTRKRK